MKYEITYQRYPNGGYPVDRFDCVDNPIAQSAGIYHYNYYYYYTFMYSLLWIWGDNPNKLFFEDRANKILRTFGLTLKRNEADTIEEAMAVVVNKLEENKPPIIRTIYKVLFYCGYYQSDEPPAYWDHAIPIYRYDSANSTVSIREQGHHFMDSTDEHRSALNIHVNFPLEVFQSMLVKWNSGSGSDSYYIYSIEESETPAIIHSFEDMLDLMLADYSGESNQINRIINDIGNDQLDNLHVYLYDLNTSIHATHLLFDGIEMIESLMKNVDKNKFQELKTAYKSKIQTVVNILRKSIIKGERLSSEKLEKYKEMIKMADEQLFDFLQDNRLSSGGSAVAISDSIDVGAHYYLRNNYTNKYLQSTSKEDLENVIQHDSLSDETQQWSFIPTDNGYYNIINRFSRKALDVMYTSIEEGANVGQFTVSGHWCQQWELEKTAGGVHKIRNRCSAKLLTIIYDSDRDGAEAIQAAENNSVSYEWELIKF